MRSSTDRMLSKPQWPISWKIALGSLMYILSCAKKYLPNESKSGLISIGLRSWRVIALNAAAIEFSAFAGMPNLEAIERARLSAVGITSSSFAARDCSVSPALRTLGHAIIFREMSSFGTPRSIMS